MPKIYKKFRITELSEQIKLYNRIMYLYENEYQSIAQIAQAHGISKEQVRRILLANDVQMRKKNNRVWK